MADTIYRGTGRRKSSVARVIIQPGSGRIDVNGRDVTNYFPVEIVRQHALSPLALTQLSGRMDVRVLVHGGGISGQAGAIRHGLARALILYDAGLRDQVKKAGMLTSDA
ncbi:MAG: 30S ribosomal protein S9, partial [Mariprofundaceae bacterium]|nr:30S ribosomal protein S9 [Mariprofundaceae bacterium]